MNEIERNKPTPKRLLLILAVVISAILLSYFLFVIGEILGLLGG